MYYLPNNPYLIIATMLIVALFMLADLNPFNRFDMKKLWAWLMLRPFDIVFLRRLQSIERHIHHAVNSVSFDILKIAQTRIELELKYRHTKKEIELINGLSEQAELANKLIESTLILEYELGL